MPREISESDWKLFRQLHAVALGRFCERVLSELGLVVADAGKGAHERYLVAFELVHRRNKELAEAFDDLRRSTAEFQLAVIRSRGLLTDAEFARFSPEIRSSVQRLLGA